MINNYYRDFFLFYYYINIQMTKLKYNNNLSILVLVKITAPFNKLCLNQLLKSADALNIDLFLLNV